MDGVELIFDESAKNVFLRLDPDTAHITHQDVMKHLDAAGFSQFLVHPQVIDNAIALHDAAPPTRQDEQTEQNSEPCPPLIAERRDARIEVLLDDLRMTATLRLIAPWGGLPASTGQCLAALASHNVVHGFDNAAIQALVMQAATLDHGTSIEAVVARGTPPQDGQDSPLETMVHTLKDRVLHPRQKADGSIDFHELGEIPVVKAGETLMRRLPPGKGSNGTTVTGEMVPAAPGKIIAFNIGQGAQLAADNADLLIAQIDGMPVPIANGMSVENVFRTPEVSVKTGNVSFGGSITVDGDVTVGFGVRADADIYVGGVVESARLVAGNDIVIPGGISGNLAAKGAAPSAFLSAGNLLCAGFAQFAELHANVGIVVTGFLLHCHLSSFNWIRAGGENPGKSRLIGGTTRALSFIKTDTLGSPDGTHTLVELTGNFASLAQEHHSLIKRIAEREHQLEQVETILATLKLKTRFPHHAEMTQRAATAQRNLNADLAQTRELLHAWEQKYQCSCDTVRLVITRKAHAGCDIVIGDKRVILTEDWGPGTIQYGRDGLRLERGKLML